MKQWYKNRKKDHFYLKAKKNDVISRAYYKIEEIDKRFRIVKKNSRVLDIGCCPGGWVQYVLNQKGFQTVVGIDILEMENHFDENFVFYNHDLNEYENIRKEFSSKDYSFDLIISDIAPNTSGNQFLDQTNSYNLSLLSVNFIDEFLSKGGNFLVKNFQGEDTEKLFKYIKSLFNKCSYVKPEASDKSSKEIYILGLEKK
jgi:23S rRNA (uridine2552-2'-O)-methyltransferase